MIPAQVNLPIIWRGCEWSAITLNWKDQDGHPINLTPWLAVAFTNEFNIPVSYPDAANGVAAISMSSTETLPLKQGVYRWNWIFKLIATNQLVPPLLAGTVEVRNPVLP